LLASIRDSYRSSIPLSKTEQKIINEIKTITQIIYRLKRARTKSQIFFILSQKLDQTIGILYDIGSNGIKRKISIYNRIKETKPFITGKDLVKFHLPAGRSYHYILKRLYAAQLDKRIRGRKEAIIWFERLKWKSSLISRQS
ncbi:MAG: hypothetical protein ABIL05_02575, partial [candidate division WOR-3 bacterium]